MRPFVLLDDARGGQSLLYRDPVEVVKTHDPDAVQAGLDALRDGIARGLTAAGFLAYEAGHALDPALGDLAAASHATPLMWFGLFERREPVDPATLLRDPAGAWAGAPQPMIDRDAYDAAIAAAHTHILDGDIYQVNLTFPARVATAGHPLALYAAIRPRAAAPHGGIVFTGDHWLLSFSPELFFTLDGEALNARPMKGTATRGANPAEDETAIETLRADPKQRAENLMIVDLLRNDLSRVSRPGSVQVPTLFAVETYPTVHQMTSTVIAELSGGLDAIDVIRAIFPCGSITGAPKLSAMRRIAQLETGPRGPYTGAIGRIGPDRAAFNVAIRTLTLAEGRDGATLGLGSGIVADSEAGSEWRECLAKGAFVETKTRFDLIETMRFDPHDGFPDLDRHLGRMAASAAAFGFAFDRHAVRNELQAATFRLRDPAKIRLMLGRSGAVAIEARALPEAPEGAVVVALTPLPVDPADFRLRHKTSDRAFYDEARRASGAFETVFVDPDGFVTEGSFTHIFVERDDTLLTPPLARGLLPGILRQRLIDEGRVVEADLMPADLADGFLVGNAVRELLPARLADASEGRVGA